MNVQDLLRIADAYKEADGLTVDSTVSHRVFGDSKKLSALRCGADITVGRFNAALQWFAANWPEGASRPEGLPPPSAEDAA